MLDPEIKKPITELGMVRRRGHAPTAGARSKILLTVAGCPMRDTLDRDVTAAVSASRASPVDIDLGVMSDEQRPALQTQLRGASPKEIPFARPDSLTRVYAVASGKGGVGKSSVTVNLAVAMASQGCRSACSTRTSTATRCRPCSGSPTSARPRSKT